MGVQNSGPNTARVVAEALRSVGVPRVFAYPGDPIIELLEQVRQADIEVVLARREGTAGFMAEATAMATGAIGVCVSTLGPGSTALVNPVAAAHLDRVPMLAISGQIDWAREQYFTHQVVDHKMLYSPITKWAGRLEPRSVGTVLRRAVSLACADRPGPVHLTIGADAGSAPARDLSFAPPALTSSVEAVRVHRSTSGEDPTGLLAGARRPVILAGIGANRPGSAEALRLFAETVGAPVVVAPMAKGIFDESQELFAGVLDMACNEVVWAFLSTSDLILAVGFDAVELIKPWTLRVPVLHIDTVPNTDQIYASSCECIGDAAAVLTWLAESWTGEPRWTAAEIADHRSKLRAAYYEGRVGGLNPSDVIDVARASAPRDAIATSDVGSHKLLVGQGWTTYEPRTTLMTNGLSAMGFSVPAAVAAKAAFPDRTVVGFVGDGGFAMTATEIRLASSLGLPVVFVVFADGSLNRIELKQQVQGYPSTATRIEESDLVRLAESMECDGVRVTSRSELEKAMDSIADLTRPLVIEAVVDPSQYESQF